MFDNRLSLTKDNILSKITEYTIFKNYCNNFEEVGKKFKSEFRSESLPSAMITYHNGRLWYKDFGSNDKAIDCFGFIQYKYGLDFKQSLLKINIDFKLNLHYDENTKPIELIETTVINYNTPKLQDKLSETYIRVKVRNWYDRDIKFWYRYNISREILERYYVQPLEWFSINNTRIVAPGFCYSFYFGKKGEKYYYKIYSPYSTKNKWVTNAANKIQGLIQLPKKGNILVITKSMKDVMVLSSFGIPAIAPQTETIVIDRDLDDNLKQRFENIFILFDNDKTGKIGSLKNVEANNYTPIFVPIESNCKDISDYVLEYGAEETKSLLTKLLIPYYI